MSKFIDANGKLKNVLVLKAFCLSFLVIIAYVLSYLVLSGPLTDGRTADMGGFFDKWGAPMLIALAGSLLMGVLMLPLQDKILVPAAFVFFAVYYVVILCLLCFRFSGQERAIAAALVSVYMLPPVLIGNLVSWGGYFLIKYIKKRRLQARLARAEAERREAAE